MLNVISPIQGTNRRSARFYKLFLSYLLMVICCLLVLGGVVYVSIISAFQQQVEEAQLSSVTQIRDTMDTRLRELQRIALQISSNPLLTPYALSQTGYGSYQAVSELNKYRTSNSFVHTIILKYENHNESRVFSASGVYEENEFFNNNYRYENGGRAALTDLMRSMKGPVIRPVETVYTYNGTIKSRYATYLYPLPANSGKPYGVVMFLLDAEMLKSMSEQLVSRPGTVLYLVDEQGQPIFTTNSAATDQGDPRIQNLNKTDSITTRTVQGVTYSVIRQGLTYNGWSFITIIPTSMLLEKVEQSRQLLGILLLALLAAGTATSFILANRNYQKLRQLVQLFSDKKENGFKEGAAMDDELVYLYHAIREEVSGQDNAMLELNSKKGLIRENVLLTLLKNKPQQTDDLMHTLELVEVRFEYSHYVSVLLVIDDYAAFQAAHPASIQELFKFRIMKAAEEQALELGRGFGVSILDDRGIALVLNIQDEPGCKSKLYALADNIQRFFQTNYQFTLSIGIGKVYDELLSVGASYEEARRALHYRFVRGNNQVLFYEDLQTHMDGRKRSYPHELENQLLKSIRLGNQDEAERCIQSITESIRSLSATPEAAQLACIGLLHMLMKAADELQPDHRGEFFRESESLNPHHMETIDMLEKQMIVISRRMCEHVAGSKESRNFKRRDDILLFLQESYSDSSLTLEKIAEHFGMSSSYITRFIKDQTGYSLIRYLDLMRMAKAKELLLTEYLNLTGITNQVGYVDVSNFIRKFKKIEGVTPEQYRKLHAKC